MRYIILILFILTTSISFSCSCRSFGDYSQKEFNNNDFIFTGTVDSQFYDTIAGVGIYYTKFKVIKKYKGDIIEEFINVRNNFGMCRAYFDEGDSYLLFLSSKYNEPIISRCSRKLYITDKVNYNIPSWLKVYVEKEDGYQKCLLTDGTLEAEGLIKNKKPIGYWKYYSFDGKVQSEGKYVNGKRDSTWTIIYNEEYSEFKKSIINYSMGIVNGMCYEFDKSNILISSENYSNGKRNGKRISYYSNGNIGTEYNYANGIQLSLKEFYKNGKNKRVRIDSIHYEMVWFKNSKINFKKYTKNNIDYYISYFKTGEIEREQFKKGKITYLINFRDDNKKIIVKNGNGFYEYGGSKGNYKDSVKTGFWTQRFNNGETRENYYKNGLKDSIANFYNEVGILIESNIYKNGIQTGVNKKYYANGAIKSETIFKNGEYLLDNFWIINGTQTITNGNGYKEDYDENGEKDSGSIIMTYVDGLWKRKKNL